MNDSNTKYLLNIIETAGYVSELDLTPSEISSLYDLVEVGRVVSFIDIGIRCKNYQYLFTIPENQKFLKIEHDEIVFTPE